MLPFFVQNLGYISRVATLVCLLSGWTALLKTFGNLLTTYCVHTSSILRCDRVQRVDYCKMDCGDDADGWNESGAQEVELVEGGHNGRADCQKQ